MEILDCCFEMNSGGAVYIFGSSETLSHIATAKTSITNSSFTSNQAANGGAVYCRKTQGVYNPLLFSQGYSNSNIALNGGFLYSSGCSVSFEHCYCQQSC